MRGLARDEGGGLEGDLRVLLSLCSQGHVTVIAIKSKRRGQDGKMGG
jgi:hypothetical protein